MDCSCWRCAPLASLDVVIHLEDRLSPLFRSVTP